MLELECHLELYKLIEHVSMLVKLYAVGWLN